MYRIAKRTARINQNKPVKLRHMATMILTAPIPAVPMTARINQVIRTTAARRRSLPLAVVSGSVRAQVVYRTCRNSNCRFRSDQLVLQVHLALQERLVLQVLQVIQTVGLAAVALECQEQVVELERTVQEVIQVHLACQV